ncbi:MAG TPA: RagB/SusD family nutrient uptake outer membrane protein [Bacteroidetes bacterium]|nr:RagB/SusD family nutrient uptake outer membrane protein [Bacteroidota bacterium]
MKRIYIISILIAGLLVSSCDEEILNKTSPNGFTTSSYYQNKEHLESATNAIYANFNGANLFGRMMKYLCACRSDEHASGGPQLEVHNAQLLNGTYDNTIYTITGPWEGLYRTIHRANSVIEFGPAIEDPTLNPDIKAHRIAEAKFLRAFCYYYLVAFWGEVPLYTETVKSPEGEKAPASESEIYTLLETDLGDIIPVLNVTHDDANLGRATKGAAQLLLARVLMHQGKYDEARTILLDVYDGPYELVDNYAHNFQEETEYNEESIFEIGFTGTNFNWWADGNGTSAADKGHVMFQDVSPTGWRNLVPSDKLLNDFESISKGDAKDDPRLSETVIFEGDTYGPNGEYTLTESAYGWYKYSPMYKLNPGGYYISTINYRNMRYAEVLIKLAECENEVGTPGAAIGYLNEIRSRPSVDMPDYPTTNYPCDSKDEIYRAIMHESLVEFSNELFRAVELARWRKNGKFSALNPEPIEYIANNPNRALLPIPSTEVSNNSEID